MNMFEIFWIVLTHVFLFIETFFYIETKDTDVNLTMYFRSIILNTKKCKSLESNAYIYVLEKRKPLSSSYISDFLLLNEKCVFTNMFSSVTRSHLTCIKWNRFERPVLLLKLIRFFLFKN